MHEAGAICILSAVLLILLKSFQFFSWQKLSKCTVTYLNGNFANDAVLPLTVASAVQK